MQCQGQMLCLYSYPDLAMHDCVPKAHLSQMISSENLSQAPANKDKLRGYLFKSPQPPAKRMQGYALHEWAEKRQPRQFNFSPKNQNFTYTQ